MRDARLQARDLEEGEAAWTAAALAMSHQLSFPAMASEGVEIRALRADLARGGVVLAQPSIAKAGAPLATVRRTQTVARTA